MNPLGILALLGGAAAASVFASRKSKDVDTFEQPPPDLGTTDEVGTTRYEIVWFTASWCQVCQRVRSSIQEINKKYNHIPIYEINVENDGVIKNYDIKGVPTFIAFKDGKEVARVEKFINKEDLENKLFNRALAAAPERQALPGKSNG